MIIAPLPENEKERLEALFRAGLLDTGVEQFFEDMVDLVQAVVPAPIVLVSLVDELRQWFKAKRGLEACETSRDLAFCAHTILSEEPLVIRDAKRDVRFHDNPLVTGPPHVEAYLGAPLILASGARLGTMCAIDNRPRDWTENEIGHLVRSSRLVSQHIDKRREAFEKDRKVFLEAALARVEERYQSVTETMTEGLVVMGPSGAIIDSNPAAWEILGLTRDELFGRTTRHPDWHAVRADGSDFPGEEHPIMVTLRTGEPQHGVPMGVQTPDGERRWLTVNSYPIRRDGEGAVEQAVAVFRHVEPRAVSRVA